MDGGKSVEKKKSFYFPENRHHARAKEQNRHHARRWKGRNLQRKRESGRLAALSDDPMQEWILTEGKATQITRIRPIGGGCINLANSYNTDAGTFFVKTNRYILGALIGFSFYGKQRLGYRLKLAQDQYGDLTIYQKGQRLIKNMAPLFENIVIEPCLLHGDLWSGNISSDKNGEPVILDPACYYGHNEAEFGMSWFAGFGGSFYSSYLGDAQTTGL